MTDDFIGRLEAPGPEPGGGAACAYVCRVGIALLKKVIGIVQQRRGRPNEPDAIDGLLVETTAAADRAARLQLEDTLAYRALAQALAGQAANEVRADAVRAAVMTPHAIMVTAAASLKPMKAVAEVCPGHLTPDLAAGLEFLSAAVEGAYRIGSANLPFMPDEVDRARLRNNLDETRAAARADMASLRDGLKHARG